MKIFFAGILSMMALTAQALSVQSVTMSGPDCDSSNTSVTFSPDNATFSILYGGMDSTSQGLPRGNEMSQIWAQERRCRILIAFRPTPGKQVELQQIDYRAFVSAPSENAYGVIESNHRFLGGSIAFGTGRTPSAYQLSGVIMTRQGPFQDDLSWSARFSPTAHFPNLGLHISNCTGQADLQIETKIRGYSNNIEEDVSIVLDSADGRLKGQSATYKIVENKCDKINQQRDRICRNRSCPN